MRSVIASSVAAVAAVLVSGCATTSLTATPNSGPQGTITGVIKLPENVSAEVVCPNLQVFAADAKGARFGEGSVHTSRNRCLYTVDYVSAGQPVTVQVQAGAAKTACALTPAAEPQPVTLQEMETRLVDVSLRCS